MGFSNCKTLIVLPTVDRDKKKEAAVNHAAFSPFSVDIFVSQKKVDRIARFMELPVIESSGKVPPILVVNFQVRGNETVTTYDSNTEEFIVNTPCQIWCSSGYKTGPVDRSKIRCFNCDELGHFAIECSKPKKVKKGKAYLKLEVKYKALLKKQQGKAYIAEGKS
ncbi:hypothetical protein AgCh_013000 [Apium graveolens]